MARRPNTSPDAKPVTMAKSAPADAKTEPLKAAPASPAKPEPKAVEAAPRDPLTLPKVAAFSTDLRTLAVNVTILLAVIIVVPVIVLQFWRSQVVIEPIAVPEAMVNTGLSPQVAAGRLWDGLEAVTERAGTAKQSVVSIPESAKVDFAIPDSGLSIDALVYYVRQFFNSYETRINGEFRCADAACDPKGQSLRIRIVSNDVQVIDMPARGDRTEEDYFRDAAAEVMSYLDPFTALAATATSDPERGKVLARRLIRSNHPDAKWALNLLGNLLRNDGDLDGALEQYQAALALDQDFPQALANTGDTLREKGDLEGAQAALQRALKRDPQNAYALAAFAELRAEQGEVDEALTYLQQAATLRPLPPIYLDKAGNMMLGAGRTDEAEALYRQALEIDPGDIIALASLGILYLSTDRLEEAERVYRAATEFSPDNAGLLGQHAGLLRTVQKSEEALAQAKRAIAIDPDTADYHLTAAGALQDLGRYPEALEALRAAERLAPGRPDVTLTFGDVYRLQDDKPEAIAAYQQFIEMSPDNTLRPLAEIYLKMLGAEPPPPVAAATDAAATAAVGGTVTR